MIGAPNSLNLNCKVRVMKEAPGPSVSEEIADIFTNYNIDVNILHSNAVNLRVIIPICNFKSKVISFLFMKFPQQKYGVIFQSWYFRF